MSGSNKKFKIILLIIIAAVLALYAYTWHKSKNIFEQLVNEMFDHAQGQHHVTHEGIKFSHNIFSHHAVIKNAKVEIGSNRILKHEGDAIITSNLLLNKVMIDSSGKSVIISDSDATKIYAEIVADKLIHKYKYNLTFTKALDLMVSSFHKHKEYAKYNFLGTAEKTEQKADDNDLPAALKIWLEHVKAVDADVVNLKVDLFEHGKMQIEKLNLHTVIDEYHLPKIKLNVDIDLVKLDSTIDVKVMQEAKALSYFNYDTHPLSLKYNGYYDIDFHSFTNFKVDTKHSHTLEMEKVSHDKSKAEIMVARDDVKKQITFAVKGNSVANVTKEFYNYMIKSYVDQMGVVQKDSKEQLSKEEITEMAQLIAIRLDEYKDINFNADLSGVVDYEKKGIEGLNSFEVKDLSVKVPTFKYGISNVIFKRDDKQTPYVGDLVIENGDVFFTDVGGYIARLAKAASIEHKINGDMFKAVTAERVSNLLKNIITKVANSNQDNKIVVSVNNKDGSYKIGTKTFGEFMGICMEEAAKLAPEEKVAPKVEDKKALTK